jgi:hypothetical protein
MQQEQPEFNQKTLSTLQIVFLLLILLMPNITLLHGALPITLFGKSLWLGLFTGTILLLALFSLVKEKSLPFCLYFLFSLALYLTSSFLRAEFFSTTIIPELTNTRFLFLIPLMIISSSFFLKDKRIYNLSILAMILAGIFQATVGLLHHFVFPEIVTGTFAHIQGKFFYIDSVQGARYLSRETGTLSNPSYYSDIICLSIILLNWIKIKNSHFLGDFQLLLIKMLTLSFLFFGLLISLNRLPILFSALFTILSIVRFRLPGKIKTTAPLVFIFLGLTISYFTYQKFPLLVQRYKTEGIGNRAQKNELGLQTISSSFKIFNLGIPLDLKKSLRTIENSGYGDNSYLTGLLATGSTTFFIWVLLNLTFISSVKVINFDLFKAILIFFFLFNYFIGDTIYADGWNFSVIITSFVILFSNKKEADLSTEDTSEKKRKIQMQS